MASIITKRGDGGMTDCLYGRREHKGSLLVEAIGNIDELSAWIGYAAKETENGWGPPFHEKVQKNLTLVMGELSAGAGNFDKYKKQFGAISNDDIKEIEDIVHKLEKHTKFDGWQTPNSPWDVTCRVARRAERSLWRYQENCSEETSAVREEVLIYINRLSDLFWIWGRK